MVMGCEEIDHSVKLINTSTGCFYILIGDFIASI